MEFILEHERKIPIKFKADMVVAGAARWFGRCFSSCEKRRIMGKVVVDATGDGDMGQAAGTAAALSVKQGIKPRQIDVELLRKTLMEQGTYVEKV